MKQILLFLSFFSFSISEAQTVTDFAGSNQMAGNVDGSGTSARFNNPFALKVDASGNIYVSDSDNHNIRKITPSGDVITFAGSSFNGSADGTGTSASFRNPQGIDINSSGDIFICDTGNHKIRKITPAGVVTTFAGSGVATSIDGTGTAATFDSPAGITIDASGNLYVTDRSRKIRKITPAGVVTSFAGSGTQGNIDGLGSAASFSVPGNMTIDASDNIYLVDLGNHNIRKITPTGLVTTIAGSGIGNIDGIGTAASFSQPESIVMDVHENLYVCESGNSKIRKISPAGIVTSYAGSGTFGYLNGIGTSANFHWPVALAYDPNGIIYVADSYNHTVRKITDSALNTPSNQFSTKLSFYPNPIKNELFFESSFTGIVEIHDLNGRFILSQNLTIGNIKINCENLLSGMYMAKVTNDKNETKTIKLVKE